MSNQSSNQPGSMNIISPTNNMQTNHLNSAVSSNDNTVDFDLKIPETTHFNDKNEPMLMNIDSANNFDSNLQTEDLTPGFTLDGNNPNNTSNLTSDSNNTNNMTTSDVNLSDNVENTEHL